MRPVVLKGRDSGTSERGNIIGTRQSQEQVYSLDLQSNMLRALHYMAF